MEKKNMEYTFDIDPNTTLNTLIDFLRQTNSTRILINPQIDQPLPSITFYNSTLDFETLQSFFG
jgi:hypothetical protein